MPICATRLPSCSCASATSRKVFAGSPRTFKTIPNTPHRNRRWRHTTKSKERLPSFATVRRTAVLRTAAERTGIAKMRRDPVFYRLFESSPETFFLVLGMSADSATDMAARYQYEAVEFKETSHRADGVFRPREAGLPLYFFEVQFYYLPSVFADLLVKAYSYLKQHDPGQAYCGVILFGSRAFEPAVLAPY